MPTGGSTGRRAGAVAARLAVAVAVSVLVAGSSSASAGVAVAAAAPAASAGVAPAPGAGAGRAQAPAETPIPPPPARFLTDNAGFLSPGAASEIDARLAAFERTSGYQLVVYIDRTTGGVPIEDWAVRAFERWRVGRRGLDDGAALFLFSDDRRVRIEVGYGLEERVPDARAARIIDGQIVPRIRAGDRDGAVRAGVASLMAAIGGGQGQGDARGDEGPQPAHVPGWALLFGGIAFVLLLGFAVTHPRLAWFLLYTIGSSRGGGWGGRGGGGWGGGGWGGGGGGFSGGGGRSGGGGASGSW